MAIAQTIESIKQNISDAYGIAEEKGATIPQNKNLENLPDTISSISGGGEDSREIPVKTYTGSITDEELLGLGWTQEDVDYFKENMICWDEEDNDYFKVIDGESDSNSYAKILRKTNVSTFSYYTSLVAYASVNTSTKTDFTTYFQNCYSLKNIQPLDTSKGTNFSNMFINCKNLENIPYIDTSKGANFSNMFSGCSNLRKIPDLITSNGTNFSNMFSGCDKIAKIPASIDFNNSTTMANTFNGCSNLKESPVIENDTTVMSSVFLNCNSLIKVNKINVPLCTDFSSAFSGCNKIIEIPNLNIPSATNMSNAFKDCWALTKCPNINSNSITTMNSMFYNCYSLRSVKNLNTSNVNNFGNMFYNCSSLQNLCELDGSKIITVNAMFSTCNSLMYFDGIKDLGKAYSTTQSANATVYGLNFNACNKLSHDSLINILNNLYDIKTKGCKTQKVTLGSSNLSKLNATTEGQQAIENAVAKGWSIA